MWKCALRVSKAKVSIQHELEKGLVVGLDQSPSSLGRGGGASKCPALACVGAWGKEEKRNTKTRNMGIFWDFGRASCAFNLTLPIAMGLIDAGDALVAVVPGEAIYDCITTHSLQHLVS